MDTGASNLTLQPVRMVPGPRIAKVAMVNAQEVRQLNGTVHVGTRVSTKTVASFVSSILMCGVF